MEALDHIIKQLESKKRFAPNGQPLWMARDLMEILGYTEWRNFWDVIEKAKDASNNAGIFSNDHFVDFTEEITAGKGAKGKRDNSILSRHACYLIAMNGDPGKPEIATAQSYFAIQTQKQEQEQQLTDEQRRLLLRTRVKDGNKALSEAAYTAGVTGAKFGIFHDAGYKGLYNGLGRNEIKQLKQIPANEDLLDCIDRVELAANEFRITQTEQKLRVEKIKGEQKAIDTHYIVGTQVRDAIKTIGGTMPEELPAAPSIKKLTAAEDRKAKKLVKAIAAPKPGEPKPGEANKS
jgi:DNA-damage-inducible protein D